MSVNQIGVELTSRTKNQTQQNEILRSILIDTLPHLGGKWDIHLPLFLTAPSLARILWLDEVYRLGLNVQGSVAEFGSQWGASFNIFNLLKIIHEPWNAARYILSFSMFEEGLNDIQVQDGGNVQVGDYSTSEGWEKVLNKIIEINTGNSAIPSCQKFEINAGDASETLKDWLEKNPHAVFSHVHFDMDVYKPTKQVMQLIMDKVPVGGVVIFDELNCEVFPGETIALDEVLGLKNIKLMKTKYQPYSSYFIKS